MRFTFSFLTRITFLLILSGFAGSAFAQTGTISGTIKDSTYNETLPGAGISIVGLNLGTQSDFEGNFKLKINPGTYSVKFTFFGYKDSIIHNVKVEAAQTTTLNLTMLEDIMSMDVIDLNIVAKTNTETAVTEEIKKSDQVVSGISSEQINKSQDRDAGQAMRRIPGVTLINNRFIMIRGLSERYNTVMINDAISPSTEVDRRTFAFDLIPSNMLDRMLVYKSGAGELPGDFAGGVIKIYTKNVLSSNGFNAGLTIGHRSSTTFRSFYDTKGSGTDFLGFDNGYRNLPDDFSSDLKKISTAEATEATKLTKNNWSIRENTARPDIRFNMGFSKRFFIGKKELGMLSGLNYSNTFQYLQAKRRRYLQFENDRQSSPTKFDYVDDQYSNSVRLGFINNWSLILNSSNKIEFKNMFNQLGEEETIIRNGVSTYQRPSDSLRNYSFGYTSRSIYSGQLSGNHELSNKKSTFHWVAGLGYLNSNTPDLRRARTYKKIGTNDPYTVIIPPTATTFDASRFYSKLNEYTVMNSADVEHKFFKEEDSVGVRLKVGYYTEYKTRDFQARWMSYKYNGSNGQIADSLSRLPLDQVFAPEHIGIFYFAEGTNPTDKYEAQNMLAASFASLLIPYKKYNLATGLRVEYNRQRLQSKSTQGALDVDNPVTSLLPFINLSYNFSKKSLIRAAYSKTLNRPEFRERAPFLFYDFQFNSDIVGNPDLTIANIHNYDVRYELYPSEGETFSIGFFYKNFINPIETYILQGADNPIYTFGNAPKATNYGVELELRKSLSAISKNKIIENISLVFNGSLINSEVKLGKAAAAQDEVRALQGQSPYVVNAGLYYIDQDKGIMINALYNVFGKRIFIVGDNNDPTVYEMPRHVIDLTASKTLKKNLEVRLGVSDLLNYKSRFLQDSNRDLKITKVDEPILLFRRGAYYTAGVNFKF